MPVTSASAKAPATAPAAAPATAVRPWLDTSLPAAQRARLLADAMTPTELAGQLLADDANAWGHSLPADDVGSLYNAQGPRLAELSRSR